MCLRALTRFAGCAFVAGLLAVSAADPPTLQHLYPVAGPRGTNVIITAAGKFDPWPPQVWVDSSAIRFQALTNKGQFSVEISPDARLGPRLVRMYNERGASSLRFFIVTETSEDRDQEPNDEFANPQRLAALPAVVNGRLDKSGDVDSFGLRLEAGETLVASLEAYTLGSALDWLLRLVDAAGQPLALNHDERTLDPFLAWEAPKSGDYILQVMGFAYPATADVRLTGGDACVYRLHLSAGARVRYTFPLAVAQGQKTTVALFGWNLARHGPAPAFEVDASITPEETSVLLPIAAAVPITIPVSDHPEATEREPNDTPGDAQEIEVPGGVSGRIQSAGDRDCFRFKAAQGDSFELEVTSASLGFPLDALLKVQDAAGKELARSDDSNTRDPRLDWTAPETGLFTAVVSEVTHQGADEYVYRLRIARAQPRFSATIQEHAFSLEASKTNELKIKVRRQHGHKARLRVAARDLPESIRTRPVEVEEKEGEPKLELIAGTEAQPWSGPFRVIATDLESNTEQSVKFELANTSIDNGVPQGYTDLVIRATDQLWLTLRAAEPPAAAASAEKAGR